MSLFIPESIISIPLFHLLELISIRCANEVALHVVDVAIRVHQVLLVLPLDLDPPHYDVVLDVDTLLFLILHWHTPSSRSINIR